MVDSLEEYNTVVYGFEMTDRLSKSDWINFGLKTLAQDGPSALKADVLARALNVSRGSFYWHFKNLNDFHTEVLNTWANASVDVANSLGPISNPKQRLALLISTSNSDELSLEAAIRSWAKDNPKIAPKVKEVDEFRIGFIIETFKDMGFDQDRAVARSRFLYAASLGRTVSLLPDPKINPALLAEIADLLTRSPE